MKLSSTYKNKLNTLKADSDNDIAAMRSTLSETYQVVDSNFISAKVRHTFA